MIWQDMVLMGGGFVFALTLLPTLLSEGSAVPRWTSLPTASVLSLFAFTYITMGFWLTAGMTGLTSLMWWGVFAWRPA